MKTYSVKESEVTHDWYVVDAAGQNLGRLSSQVAAVLRGKHKPTFTPHMDTGDFVIIVNAEKIEVTGKRADDKMYYRFSGYPGGMKSINLRGQLATHPERVLIESIKGMLPHNRLGRAMFKKLKVYAGPEHPHAAQNPKKLEF
ncbi:MAG: 50S ribosomal protein L13 [Anaerolineae bacterium]